MSKFIRGEGGIAVKRLILISLMLVIAASGLVSCKAMTKAQYEEMQRKARQADQLADQIRQLKAAHEEMEDELRAEIEAQRVQIEQLSDREVKVTMQQDIIFPSSSIVINRQGRRMLAKIAKSLRKAPDAKIKIVGHTDLLPITDSKLKKRFIDNWELSAARAASVARVFIWGENINEERIFVVGRSYVEPVADNRTEEGRQKNRRIEIFLVQ